VSKIGKTADPGPEKPIAKQKSARRQEVVGKRERKPRERSLRAKSSPFRTYEKLRNDKTQEMDMGPSDKKKNGPDGYKAKETSAGGYKHPEHIAAKRNRVKVRRLCNKKTEAREIEEQAENALGVIFHKTRG